MRLTLEGLLDADLDRAAQRAAHAGIVAKFLAGLRRILVREVLDRGREAQVFRDAEEVGEVEGKPVTAFDTIGRRRIRRRRARLEAARRDCAALVGDRRDVVGSETEVVLVQRVVDAEVRTQFRRGEADRREVQEAEAVVSRGPVDPGGTWAGEPRGRPASSEPGGWRSPRNGRARRPAVDSDSETPRESQARGP